MEAKLCNDKDEREMHGNLAEVFVIIKATEKLEKAYARDIISPAEYETECQKMIVDFKILSSTLKDTDPNVKQIQENYEMDCPAALNRLINSGVPGTIEQRAAAAMSATSSVFIAAECVQNFINAMDGVKLNMVAADEVHPLLLAVSTSLDKLSILPHDFEGMTKMRKWIATLSNMGVADRLSEEQSRQLLFDLESSYFLFFAALPAAGT